MTSKLTTFALCALMMLTALACDNAKKDSTQTPEATAPKDGQPQDSAQAPKAGQTDNPAAKEQDIRKLLDLTGSGKLGVQVMEGMIANFKQANPNVPEAFWSDFMKEVSPNGLVDLIVPIYDKHFTHDDIKGLIQFYEGPLGKKVTSSMPQITQESMAVGQKWGMDLGMKIQTKLQAAQGAPEAQGGAQAPSQDAPSQDAPAK